MYRSIIIVLLAFTSCGFSNYINKTSSEKECRLTNPVLNASRSSTHNCFRSIVRTHLNLDKTNRNCSNVSDMEKQLKAHIQTVKTECSPNLMTNESIILELVNFSLSNDSFKDLYSDNECVAKKQTNISRCINGTVGSSNKPHKKHSSWIAKSQLIYNNWSCDMSKDLKICVEKALSGCKPTTREFVASLFNISISHCHDLNSNSTGDTDPPKPKPVAAILGISAAVILVIVGVIIVIIIVIVKMRRKQC